MKYNKFFEIGEKEGLEALELYISKNTSTSFSLFRSEVDNFSISDSFSVSARGIYNGKMGYAITEKFDKTTPRMLVEQIKINAAVTDKNASEIFKGSEKYSRKNVNSKKIEETALDTKIAYLKEIDNCIRKKDSRISEVEAQYEERIEEIAIMNSYGLNLKSKTGYFVIYASTVAQDEEGNTKNAYELKFGADLDLYKPEDIADEVVRKTISQFGGKPCKSGKYRCVLNPNTAASLIGAFVRNISAEEVQKNTSLLKDKIDQQVASSKFTLIEDPLKKNIFFRYFDDEGVATYKKELVKKGVLKTFLYNLETAKKAGCASTGNGYNSGGGKMGISSVNLYVKPGKLSEEQLFEKVSEGIYITNVQGLHSGLNPQSGNFSLQASGYMIHEGKKAEPVTLITIAGNLFEMFKEIKEVGANETLTTTVSTPSIYLKKIAVSGK